MSPYPSNQTHSINRKARDYYDVWWAYQDDVTTPIIRAYYGDNVALHFNRGFDLSVPVMISVKKDILGPDSEISNQTITWTQNSIINVPLFLNTSIQGIFGGSSKLYFELSANVNNVEKKFKLPDDKKLEVKEPRILLNANDCMETVTSVPSNKWDNGGVNLIGIRNTEKASGRNKHDDILMVVTNNVLRGVFACSMDPGIIRTAGAVSHLANRQHQYKYCYLDFKTSGKKFLHAIVAYQQLDRNADGRITTQTENNNVSTAMDLQIHCGGSSMDDPVVNYSWGCTVIVCNVWYNAQTNQKMQEQGSWGGPPGAMGKFLDIVHENTVNSGTEMLWGTRQLDKKTIFYTAYNKNKNKCLTDTYDYYQRRLRGTAIA